jgi:hypothetical protein
MKFRFGINHKYFAVIKGKKDNIHVPVKREGGETPELLCEVSPSLAGFPAEFCYQRFSAKKSRSVFVIAHISFREIRNVTKRCDTMQFAETGGDKFPNFAIFTGKSKHSSILPVLKSTSDPPLPPSLSEPYRL